LEGAYIFITGRRQSELDTAVKTIGSNVTGLGSISKEHFDRIFNTNERSGLYRSKALPRCLTETSDAQQIAWLFPPHLHARQEVFSKRRFVSVYQMCSSSSLKLTPGVSQKFRTLLKGWDTLPGVDGRRWVHTGKCRDRSRSETERRRCGASVEPSETATQAELGVPVAEVIRKVGISEQTFSRWKKQYVGMETDQARQMLNASEKQYGTGKRSESFGGMSLMLASRHLHQTERRKLQLSVRGRRTTVRCHRALE
jgi:hypothetical protein